MNQNLILATDGYKPSHYLQLPPDTTGAFHYVEARKTGDGHEESVILGGDAVANIFAENPITRAHIDEAEAALVPYGVPFNRAGWERIVQKHGGQLPIEFCAAPDGLVVPNGNVVATVQTLDPELPWVAGYFETLILRGMWYPSTVATKSRRCKQVIAHFMGLSCDSLDGLEWKLHDFGARASTSAEAAAIGGAAHLVNFKGTDTIEALAYINKLYDCTGEILGGSIPAAEHFTITSWGKEHEVDAYRNMLTQFAKPGAVVAVVSDSYDIENACKSLWCGELKQQVIDSGATVVIRPDSGDPVQNVSSIAQWLDAGFGHTVNSKGFKVLNHVRIIQGDGIDGPEIIAAILNVLLMNGYSADNVAFGMGGGLLQHVNRDTEGFTMKCSAIRVGGFWRDVYKEAPGKKSKRGRLTLYRDSEGHFHTDNIQAGWTDLPRREVLEMPYYLGGSGPQLKLSEVRARAAL